MIDLFYRKGKFYFECNKKINKNDFVFIENNYSNDVFVKGFGIVWNSGLVK